MRKLLILLTALPMTAYGIDPLLPIWEQAKRIKCTDNVDLMCNSTIFGLEKSPLEGCNPVYYKQTWVADFTRDQWKSLSHGPDHIPWKITGYNFAGKNVQQISVGQRIIDFWPSYISPLGVFDATMRFSHIERDENRNPIGAYTNIRLFNCIVQE